MSINAVSELRHYRNRVLSVLVIAVGGFFLWASVTDLEKGVHVVGTVAPDTRRKVVQPQIMGIVQAVLGREGQELKSGDPIVTLDPEKLVAEEKALTRRLIELELSQERFRAELQGSRFRPDLRAYQTRHPEVDLPTLLALAESAAAASNATMAAQLESIDARLGRLSSEAKGAAAAIDLIVRQRDISQARVDALRPLVSEGLISMAEFQRQEQQLLDTKTRLEERQVTERSARGEFASLTAERHRVIQDNRRRLSEALASMGVEAQQTRGRLAQIAIDLASSTVRAPVDGQLVGFVATTVGSVVQAGQTIGQIVPAKEPLIIEASVGTKDIERISVGSNAEVRFSSLPRKVSPLLRGTITYVSRDTIGQTADMNKSASQQTPGYQIRVLVDSEQLKKLGKFEIISGMSAEIFTEGGTQSVVNYYFVSPIAQLFERAMREY